jgi:hypothetical protein
MLDARRGGSLWRDVAVDAEYGCGGEVTSSIPDAEPLFCSDGDGGGIVATKIDAGGSSFTLILSSAMTASACPLRLVDASCVLTVCGAVVIIDDEKRGMVVGINAGSTS